MTHDFLNDVPTRLVNILNSTSPGDLDYDIATGILSHMREIADGNIQDAAELCFVSTSTISRFMKKLNFENYNSFKYRLSSDLYTPRFLTSPVPLSNLTKDASPVEFYFQLLKQHIQTLENMATPSALDFICATIYEAEKISIYSLNDLNFTSFQVGMANLNKLIPHLSLDFHFEKMLPSFNEHFLMIAPVYATSNSIEKLRLCKETGAKVIAICRNNKPVFADFVDFTLGIDSASPEMNRYMLNFLFDLILIHYYQKYGN